MRHKLPIILQSEAAECGLACLAMIGHFYGQKIGLASLRRMFPTSARGSTLGGIVSTAENMKFNCRALRIELEQIQYLQTPCILHWNMNHFVVLKRASASKLTIHDPASGPRELSLEEASPHFTGVSLELLPAESFQTADDPNPVSIVALTGRLQGLGKVVTQLVLLALGIEAMALVAPFYMQTIVDQVVVANDLRLLTVLAIAFICITTLEAALGLARGIAITHLSGSLNVQWSSNLFSHLVRLPLAFFEKRSIGDVISRFSSIEVFQRTLTANFVESVLNGILGVAILLILFAYSPLLAVMLIVAVLAYVALRYVAFKLVWKLNERQIVCAAQLQTTMVESIRGIQSVKLANKQGDRASRFSRFAKETSFFNVGVQRIGFFVTSGGRWIFGLQRVIAIWVGATLVLKDTFTIGMLVAFVAYGDQFVTRFTSLIDKLVEFKTLRLHGIRIADITMTQSENAISEARSTRDFEHSIEFVDVGFRYSESDPWVFRGCSFRVEAGASIAIVGRSGCGKSTLAKILTGLLEPTEGRILIGGMDLRQLGVDRLRAVTGCVMQNDELFEGTIADNISFFDDDAHPVEIEAAAKKAAIHDEVVAMPMGYETLVGDMGSSLSGGQKQRVMLARAFYREPKILVLDEATSHLDGLSEQKVNAATKRSGATQIIIAHRRETVEMADGVFDLSDEAFGRNNHQLEASTA